MKNKAVIAGGSGFLGQALAASLLQDEWEVIILTRHPDKVKHGRGVFWDGQTLGVWKEELEHARALVNLTGKNVKCRQTAANRERILSTRVDSARALGLALRQCLHPPKTWIQASSLAIYGNAGDRLCDEAAAVPHGYPMDVCVAWEEALGEALLPHMRWVVLRIGFVIGNTGGALPLLARLARWGLGGAIGSGRQWISWLHLDDMTALFREAIAKPEFTGVYNATGPNPVTNAKLMKEVRRAMRRPWSPPIPAIAVQLGAPLIDSDPLLGLTGRRGLPGRLAHFPFRFPDLPAAMADLYPKKRN